VWGHERSVEWFDWRFSNPNWEYRTYLARRNGRLVGSLVTCTETVAGVSTTRVADALPLVGGSAQALATLVSAVVADTPTTAVLSATSGPTPARVLAGFGFVADDGALLSQLVTTTTDVTRPLPSKEQDGDWRVAGLEVDAAENWVLSPSDQDIA
jgi:hypothetical protein